MPSLTHLLLVSSSNLSSFTGEQLAFIALGRLFRLPSCFHPTLDRDAETVQTDQTQLGNHGGGGGGVSFHLQSLTYQWIDKRISCVFTFWEAF